MKKSRFTESQIVAILKEGGSRVAGGAVGSEAREEMLSAYLFDSLDEVREITTEWLEQYNEIRPHDALEGLPPARYRERLLAPEIPVWNCLLDRGAYGAASASPLK